MNVTPVNTTDTLAVTTIKATDDQSDQKSNFDIVYDQTAKTITLTAKSTLVKTSVAVAVSCGGATTQKTITIAG